MSTMQASSLHDPLTRSRTLLFLSYRDSSATRTKASRGRPKSPAFHNEPLSSYGFNDAASERQGLMNGVEDIPGHISIEVDTLPPKW